MERELVDMSKDYQSLDDFQLITTIQKLSNEEKAFGRKFLDAVFEKTDQTQSKYKKRSKNQTISRSETFVGLIKKMDQNLQVYELTDNQVDDIKIDFIINPELKNTNDQVVIKLHTNLMSSGEGLVKTSLFYRMERGRIYQHIKETKFGEWEKFCSSQLEISSHTASRHIEFFRLCTHYPRLLIVGLSFEAIMSFNKDLISYLKANPDFSGRLAAPLKRTKILGKEIKSETLLPNPSSRRLQISQLSREKYKWNPGWEVNDEQLYQIAKLNAHNFNAGGNDQQDDHNEVTSLLARMSSSSSSSTLTNTSSATGLIGGLGGLNVNDNNNDNDNSDEEGRPSSPKQYVLTVILTGISKNRCNCNYCK